ncbi:MAG: hypothetical protein Q4C83_01065 [Candidatus Saccharibacteria bacterium]|nr:hypothetical protein [Candidatus Saccharibacteria bacterium]
MDRMKPEAFIIDIDGTVALNGGRDYIDYSKVIQDEPSDNVIDILDQINWDYYVPIFVTGRNESCIDDTRTWINEYMDVGCCSNPYQLHMRPKNDRRPDCELKKEIYDRFIKNNYKVVAVFEDRTRCVKMWREQGLTCLQVADGNY